MSRSTLALVSTLAGAGIASVAACNMGGAPSPSAGAPNSAMDQPDGSASGSAGSSGQAPPIPFQADTPDVYVAKAKNILVGLPPTDTEIRTVTADPSQLKTLITAWMALPQYQEKMMRFFELAFQQTQVIVTDYVDQGSPKQIDINGGTTPPLVQNLQESFARTMLELTSKGEPFTQAVTTQSFMMTPALMELYAFFDSWEVDDNGKVTDNWAKANPALNFYVEYKQGPLTIDQTLDSSNSTTYMHWYDPDVANSPQGAGCNQDPIVFPADSSTLHYVITGALLGRNVGTTRCQQYGGTKTAGQLSGTDFTAWKMVTIRPPNAGESPTPFYDLKTMRTGSELVLKIPRIGFFSTPAFFANWQTNTSNEMRVTTNQALIVALGSMIDGTDSTTPPSTPGLDSSHAAPGTACYNCHQLLDPTRSILSATYSYNYHYQVDPKLTPQPGLFAFQGVVNDHIKTIGDFANTLATHPLFPQAWVQKLCYYVNSTACDTTDPEFLRLVSVFKSSNYSWNTLVAELLSSPITTYATETKTSSENSEVVAVSRRDHLCASLNNRLGFTDICGLDTFSKGQQTTTIPEIVSGLPSDGYGRGSVAPVLPNQPTLFYRAATENMCEAVAALVIDVPSAKQIAGVKQWSSSQPDAAISDFVSILMALAPSDPRSAQAEALLKSHFTAASQASGSTPTAALQSTFVAACLAPSSVSIGL